MTVQHEDYCRPGSVFFETGADPGEAEFALLAPVPGRDWLAVSEGPWRNLHPIGRELPEQGWKVHVAATPGNAREVLAETYAWCVDAGMTFKHLRSPREVLRANAKYAPRGSSGKFLTLYPIGEEQLRAVLSGLGERLRGVAGPYILSDLRISDGPLHVRYGGFRRMLLDDGDETRAAVRTPTGELVPDERTPGFKVPPWVTPPGVIAEQLVARGRTELPWKITGALHFSNGGGVYRAMCDDRGEILVKEARPHAGLDARGVDAVARLRREHTALVALAGIPGIPDVYDLRPAWEHLFLAREYLPGSTLNKWLVRNYPLGDEADAGAYRKRAMLLADRLDELIARVHERGWSFGDLHPGNVLVDADDRPGLIDAEQACPIEQDAPPGLAGPGFADPRLRGIAADRYALAALRLWLLVPLAPMAEISQETRAAHLTYAITRFGLPRRTGDRLRGALSLPPVALRETTKGDLVRAILASATPERSDRLFPGDPAQFDDGGASLGHGAAGVLYALHRAGTRLHPEHVDWLRAHATTTRPGLWSGGHGTALVLDRLGYADDADELLVRCAPEPDRPLRPGLANGAAGIAWALMKIAERRRDSALLDEAITLALRVAELPEDAAPAAGLMRGWSGAGLLFTLAHEHTGDDRWLDLASTAVQRDLRSCVPVATGGLHVHDGRRTLPYLEHGSAGIALVAARLARHRPDDPAVSALPELLAGCRHAFVIYPGLMQGRAGLLLVDPRGRPSDLDLHAVPYAGGTAFPGVTLRRLSMDLGTGTAGVLLALTKHRPEGSTT